MDLLLAELANFSSQAAATVTVTATATAASFSQPSSNSSASAETTGVTLKPASTSSKNLGPALGAGIGVPLGLLAFGIVGFLFWRERKIGKMHAEDRQRVIEMNPGNMKPFNEPQFSYIPGPPPAPPVPPAPPAPPAQLAPPAPPAPPIQDIKPDYMSWESTTSTLQQVDTRQPANRDHNANPTGVHELI